VNFLQLLGYPPATDEDGHREVFSFDEFSAGFDWRKVNTVGPDLRPQEAGLAQRPLHPDAALQALETLEPWGHDEIQATLRRALVEDRGIKPRLAFGPVRVAVTGSRVSPPLFESLEILGQASTLERLARLRRRL
jgi:glutamyl-tRNA synthetase